MRHWHRPCLGPRGPVVSLSCQARSHPSGAHSIARCRIRRPVRSDAGPPAASGPCRRWCCRAAVPRVRAAARSRRLRWLLAVLLWQAERVAAGVGGQGACDASAKVIGRIRVHQEIRPGLPDLGALQSLIEALPATRPSCARSPRPGALGRSALIRLAVGGVVRGTTGRGPAGAERSVLCSPRRAPRWDRPGSG